MPAGILVTMHARNRYFFALLDVAGLLVKEHYSGPYQQAVRSYGGNVIASFALHAVVALMRPFSQGREAV